MSGCFNVNLIPFCKQKFIFAQIVLTKNHKNWVDLKAGIVRSVDFWDLTLKRVTMCKL